MSQECLNPDYLVERLSSVLSEKIKHTLGHIHCHFRSKSDHIIFVWSKGTLKKIAVKSPSCKKGQSVRWKDSQFCDYNRGDILRELYDEIERIEIDGETLSKIWPSCGEFVEWLFEN